MSKLRSPHLHFEIQVKPKPNNSVLNLMPESLDLMAKVRNLAPLVTSPCLRSWIQGQRVVDLRPGLSPWSQVVDLRSQMPCLSLRIQVSHLGGRPGLMSWVSNPLCHSLANSIKILELRI